VEAPPVSPGGKLHYQRTKAGAEVDFIVARGGRLLPIEVKWTERPAGGHAPPARLPGRPPPASPHGYVVCRCPEPLASTTASRRSPGGCSEASRPLLKRVPERLARAELRNLGRLDLDRGAVRGLRPVRAARLLTVNVPKPTIVTRCPSSATRARRSRQLRVPGLPPPSRCRLAWRCDRSIGLVQGTPYRSLRRTSETAAALNPSAIDSVSA